MSEEGDEFESEDEELSSTQQKETFRQNLIRRVT